MRLSHLAVLVDEHERIRHVGVSEVDERGAYPRATFGLGGVQQLVHRPRRARRVLHALQPLARVALRIWVGRAN
jgi:hypothetical protein